MHTWIIEPRDPLIARDGRPFQATPGARARTLTFPFPSTTTGGVRARAGLDANGVFDRETMLATVKQIAVAGPLLVEMDDTGALERWLVPAPADALLLPLDPPQPHAADLRRLVPLATPAAAVTNLPGGLFLVGQRQPDPRKPRREPHYWYWDCFVAWLADPKEERVDPAALGHNGPMLEQRTHVCVQSDEQTAKEGALFQTRGLEFTFVSQQKGKPAQRRRLGLAVMTDAAIKPGIAPLGSERRLMCWRQSQAALPPCPQGLRDRIVKDKACRLVLLTPALFDEGYRPGRVLTAGQDVTIDVQAAAVPRPQVVSGWDMERLQPKPTRRLAPAGSVYFLKLTSDDDAAVARWADKLWLSCISDDTEARRDGFGLAVLGAWSGTPETMEMKS